MSRRELPQFTATRGQPSQASNTSAPHRPAPPNRDNSNSSASSSSSQTTMKSTRPVPPSASTNNLTIPARQYPPRKSSAQTLRPQASSSSLMPASVDYRTHRKRSSQGFFEPSLRSMTSLANVGGSVLKTPSAIAAQTAMGGGGIQHIRKRSQALPDPAPAQRRSSNTPAVPAQRSTTSLAISAGPAGTNKLGLPHGPSGAMSATAAASAFPRSPLGSPTMPQDTVTVTRSPPRDMRPPPAPAVKEKSRMKLFSKPKTLNLSKEKEAERRPSTLSPVKMYNTNAFARMNQSTTSLAESNYSGASSLYSSVNASTSTLVPDRGTGEEKEKHKHNFLSRQKHKLEKEHYNLPLSSASSNSRPTDPNAPQSLYSFAPASPAPGSTFSKSISGLDLRHGGRALREKKREEKAAQANVGGAVGVEHAASDWLGAGSLNAPSFLGPPSASGGFTPVSAEFGPHSHAASVFSLPNVTSDDAWPLLQARLLGIFSGDEIRTPVEDLNKLVTMHLQRCVQRKVPSIIIEDLRDLLQTGFASLDQTLRRIPDDRLVPYLVDMWLSVFGTILPFMQAVFLPLDLEFKGRGSIMTSREAADFWGALPVLNSKPPLSGPPTTNILLTRTITGPSSFATAKTPIAHLSLGEALDVRTLVLLSFRDIVILPRHDTLLTIFSRSPFESFNTEVTSPRLLAQRPGTSASVDIPSNVYSTSQASSTLLSSTTATSGSLGARSRATSNTSAGSFQSLGAQRPHPSQMHAQTPQQNTAMDPAKVTQIAARMLQCISVLAGLQAPGAMLVPVAPTASALDTDLKSREQRISEEIEDIDGHSTAGTLRQSDFNLAHAKEAEERKKKNNDPEMIARRKIEALAKELKLNWLGRGRTGRNRRGFVGSKARTPLAVGMGVAVVG